LSYQNACPAPGERAGASVVQYEDKLPMTKFCEKPLGFVVLMLAVLICFGCANSVGGQNAGSGSDTGDSAALDSGTAGDTSDAGLSAAWPDGKYLSPSDVYQRGQDSDPDMLLVNVVDEEYYSLGHVANSLKIPWDILADNLSQVDKSRHIVLYCRRGVRSESAYETLMSNVYPYVWIMEGGIEAWIAAGYPTVSD
jgi:rhodanese-related sulfurtransferase